MVPNQTHMDLKFIYDLNEIFHSLFGLLLPKIRLKNN